MSANILAVPQKRNIRLRGIALPNEHGSWGFLFEPMVAAVAVAPSFASVWIALMVIGAFLTRQPLKILLSDLSARRNWPQITLALRFVFFYGTIFLIGLGGSLTFARFDNFIPFVLIIPFGIYQIYCDVSRQSRQLLPELTGAMAISSSAAVITLAGGWSFGPALALWGIFVARFIPSILYVRNRLRLEKGKDFSMIPVIAAHFISVGGIGMLAGNGVVSMLTFVMVVLLLVRAFFGLSPYRTRMKAMQIGVWEVIYGILTVLSIVIGYYLQI